MKRTRSCDAFRGYEDAPLLRIASIVFWYRPVVVSATRQFLRLDQFLKSTGAKAEENVPNPKLFQ